jgi:hypothetical protein
LATPWAKAQWLPLLKGKVGKMNDEEQFNFWIRQLCSIENQKAITLRITVLHVGGQTLLWRGMRWDGRQHLIVIWLLLNRSVPPLILSILKRF